MSASATKTRAEQRRPFHLSLDPWNREVAMVSECEGAFVIEPMRFITLFEAKRDGKKIARAAGAAEEANRRKILRGLGR